MGENRHGRQLARVSAPQDEESLVSLVYPGYQTSQACLHPTAAAVERLLACLQPSDPGLSCDSTAALAPMPIPTGPSGTASCPCGRAGLAARHSSTVYRNASFVGHNRVVFNIRGNRDRLVVAINYAHGLVHLRFIGSHQDYDKIDADTICKDRAMDVRPIKTEADYQAALADIERLFDAAPNTPVGDCLDVLATLVEAYEAQHYNLPAPDPIEAITYHMESRGLSRRDLEPYLGSRARVAEVLNRKRPLSLDMIRRLHTGLGIAADVLIQPYALVTSAPNPRTQRTR